MFSPDQIQELMSVMDRYTTTFIAKHVGYGTLSNDEIANLVMMGMDPKQIKDSASNVTQAFKFGLLSDAIGNQAAKGMNYSAFKKFLASGRSIPLNAKENAALNALKMQTALSVRKHAEDMKKDVQQDLVEIQRGRAAIHSKKVLSVAEEVIRDRQGVAQLRSKLGKRTGQWDRNMGRMAAYVLHDAFNEGRVSSIERKGSKVYFDVFDGACKHCVRLYLTGGIGSEPRVFSIDELRANGSNVGLKTIEWKATIGPIHPHCRCTANEVPDGYEWDPSTRSFTKPIEFKRKVERKSKVTVTVGGKQTVI